MVEVAGYAAAVAPAPHTAAEPILAISDLRTSFFTRDGVVRAVDGVSLHVRRGETLAIVGESGCGKSVTALSVLRLVAPPGRIVSGAARFSGRDLFGLSEARMRRLRGNEISMIFQEPMTSLNPVLTIGHQIAETLTLHQRLGRTEALARTVELLQLVHIPDAHRRIGEYPHQLSGGMRQRVMIAMALACNPKLLIADEPTTALDVTIQAQILDLLRELKQKTRMAIVLITHDLGVVAEMAQRVVVMYAGRLVEEAPVATLFRRPLHPYTKGLLASLPRLGASLDRGSPQRLAEIRGAVLSPLDTIAGCAFAGRCSFATEICRRQAPALDAKEPEHFAACHYWDRIADLAGDRVAGQ
jgi:peptide/nickel transport system ATP-binding protein